MARQRYDRQQPNQPSRETALDPHHVIQGADDLLSPVGGPIQPATCATYPNQRRRRPATVGRDRVAAHHADWLAHTGGPASPAPEAAPAVPAPSPTPHSYHLHEASTSLSTFNGRAFRLVHSTHSPSRSSATLIPQPSSPTMYHCRFLIPAAGRRRRASCRGPGCERGSVDVVLVALVGGIRLVVAAWRLVQSRFESRRQSSLVGMGRLVSAFPDDG